MAFHDNPLSTAKVIDVNQQLAEIDGLLDDNQTKDWISKFLEHNIFYLFKMLIGNHPADKKMRLFPFQEVLLKMLFEKDNVLCVVGRGIGKTSVAVWFIALYCIIYPNSKIGILSPSFRKSRDIFKGIEDLAARRGAGLLSDCIETKRGAPDLCWMKFRNGSEVFALPLGATGDKIRGYRFNVVILDEAGFVPEKIITSVIIPFLSTNTDPIGRIETIKREDDLIARGLMTEDQRTRFQNNKFLAFSSATFQFQYLYTMYKNYKRAILNPRDEDKLASYGLFQMSYEAAPEGLLNKSSTENARNSLSTNEFLREYCGQFPSDSDSYFKMSKMEAATVPPGEEPCVEIVGDKKSKYLVAIDPNSMNESSNADHFSISVFKLNDETRENILVHQFAACELNISDYIWYFLYILENFNVVMVVVDKAGGDTFINICNESQMFKDRGIDLNFFEADFEIDPKEYVRELNRARRAYNLESKRICYSQYFTNDWKRRANEHLQYCIEYKKVWFAAEPSDLKFDSMIGINIGNFDKLKFHSGEETGSDKESRKLDFIDNQKVLMKEVKNQCSLIEMKPNGNSITFELPTQIRRLRGENKTNRDSWTSLYLGNYLSKSYYDMMSSDDRFNYNTTWTPWEV